MFIKRRLNNIYHYLLAWAGNVFYGNPSKNLIVIGVTGTKGKTSTVELIATALNACGKKTAIISGTHIVIGDKEELNSTGNTMMGKGRIQKALRDAVKAKCQVAVVEVTSLGAVQHRHRFIEWDMAVITNLHPEHIEAHGGFENYREAKLDFFRYTALSPKKKKVFFINKEDEYAECFATVAGNHKKVFYKGTFMRANYAVAIKVADYFGCDLEIVEKALENFSGIPGRMEVVVKEPFRVIVDYAHTPDSLEQAYKWVMLPQKLSHANSKLICVLGSAGGGRDKWKRSKMGEVAAKYCDEIIITDEDSYDESPMEIINAIAKGVEDCGKNVIKIIDRQEAIDKAIALAERGDTVILTGKGNERFIHFANDRKIEWSDKEAVLRAMEDRNKI